MTRPAIATPLSRRRVLRWAALGLAAPAAAAVAGCVGAASPDPLIELARSASSDATLIEDTARHSPALAPGLAPAAAARRAHATALTDEVHRLDPRATVPPTAPSIASPTSAAAAPGSAGMETVRAALDASARAAADHVSVLTGYRAALVGSVAACCAAYRTLLT